MRVKGEGVRVKGEGEGEVSARTRATLVWRIMSLRSRETTSSLASGDRTPGWTGLATPSMISPTLIP